MDTSTCLLSDWLSCVIGTTECWFYIDSGKIMAMTDVLVFYKGRDVSRVVSMLVAFLALIRISLNVTGEIEGKKRVFHFRGYFLFGLSG